MHTDRQQKRRTLLLLVLLLSTVMLFDALMIFNRQEPQTYQSRASTITDEEPSPIEIARNYTSAIQFLEDLGDAGLTDTDEAEIISILRDDINSSLASAGAQLDNLFLGAQETITAQGETKLMFRQDDVIQTNQTIINVIVPIRGYYDTVTYFSKESTTYVTVGKKHQAVEDAKKLLKETDVDKIATSQELAQKDKEIADAMAKIDEVDSKPNIYGPLQYSDKELSQLRLDLLIKRLQLLETLVTVKLPPPATQNTVQPPVEQPASIKNTEEIEKLKDNIKLLEEEIKKLKDQKAPATSPVSTAGTTITQSSNTSPSEDVTQSPTNICQTTNKNQGGQYTCNNIAIGARCLSTEIKDSGVSQTIQDAVGTIGRFTYNPIGTGATVGKKVLFNYVCEKNEVLSTQSHNVTCDCVSEAKGIAKFVKNHKRIVTVVGILVVEEIKFGIIRNAISGGGDGGGGGNPTGRY